MSSKNDEKLLMSILEESRDIKRLVIELQKALAINDEKTNLIHAQVSDLSIKADFGICANITTIDKKATAAASTPSGKRPNKMVFFKQKFKLSLQEPSKTVPLKEIEEAKLLISKIVSEEELNDVFEANIDEIKAKKKKDEIITVKANIAYRELIKSDESKKTLIGILQDEEMSSDIVDPEITEADESDREVVTKKPRAKSPVAKTKARTPVAKSPVRKASTKSPVAKTTSTKTTKSSKAKEPTIAKSSKTPIKESSASKSKKVTKAEKPAPTKKGKAPVKKVVEPSSSDNDSGSDSGETISEIDISESDAESIKSASSAEYYSD